MIIKRLELDFFRNYAHLEAEFDPRVNLIYGDNAQGKTNLLEAVSYLSAARSHRARYDKEMIMLDVNSAFIRGEVFSRNRDFNIEAHLFRGRGRQLCSNGVRLKTAGELAGILNTVLFCPEDLSLIRAGAAERRKFLDGAICQLRPRYAQALAEYNRLYDHKTRILRDCIDRPDLIATLPDFNLRMAETGAVLIHYRSRFVQRLARHAAAAYGECSGGRETLTAAYQTVSTVEDPGADLSVLTDWLRRHMEEHQTAERTSRLCLSGPHKDDLLVSINGREAKQYASQGQTRTAALALKLAEREIYKNVLGEYPILLLDDVLSELDPRRQEFVLNRIAGGQVFITCCEEDRLPSLLGGKVLYVEDGIIR